MTTPDEIQAERTLIEQQNKSLRQRLKTQRQNLEDYLAEASRYAETMKKIEQQISQNNERYFELGKQLRQQST